MHLDEDPKLVAFNDAKCDSLGRLWAGTITTGFVTKRGALYRSDADGSVTTMLKNVTISNGLGWSPDGSTFYYIDSPTGNVDAFGLGGRGRSVGWCDSSRNDFRLLRAPIELVPRSALRGLGDMLTPSYGQGAIGYALAVGVVE